MTGILRGPGETADVVIVGGGVVGSAIAYFLADQPAFDGRVVVVERDPTYAEASTPRSTGSIRQQFSTPENIAMSQYGIAFLDQMGDRLAVDGEQPDVGFHAAGYLFLATPEGRAILEANHGVQRAHGADVALLTPPQLRQRFPWLNVDDLAAGSLGLSGEGWFDPFALLQAFRRRARALGAVYRHDEVTALDREGDRIVGLRLGSGDKIACGAVVNAAGPRAAAVAAMAGLEVPVRPRKRMTFFFHCRTTVTGCPLVIDPTGFYFRPEGDGFLTGVAPGPHEDPDCLDLDVDHAWFEERLWPGLAHRVPVFEAIKPIRAWAGHYAVNTFDHNAILGPHPEVTNFLFANGFSGHGLQQSPAVGRAISELIAFGAYRSLNLSRFDYGRIARDEPVVEVNVV